MTKGILKKQTAVDWLIEQLTPSISLQQKHIDDLKEKAKEMERLQSIDDFTCGSFEGYKGANGFPSILVNDYINKKISKMKATELRIGNIVDLGNRIAKIIEISNLSCAVADLEETQDTIEDYERTKPIPLTEEWLFKLGFENTYKNDNDYITYTDSNHDYYLQIDTRRRDGKYTILDNSFDDLRDFSNVYIIYVHQLQNIYFALTGEELTLNKTKMKGILKKTKAGWIVIYDEILGENIVKKNQNSLPLHPEDIEKFKLLSEMFDNFEARVNADPEVEFEIIDNTAKLIHNI